MNKLSQWPRIAVLVAAGALGAGACTSAEDESQPSAAGFAEHMHGHLDEVNAIKAAVIAGDLEMARPPAVWLSEHSEPAGMPDDWSPYLWEMRQYASTIASARDLRPRGRRGQRNRPDLRGVSSRPCRRDRVHRRPAAAD